MASTRPDVLVVGLTGGVACGKSTLRSSLVRRAPLAGFRLVAAVDADALGHRAYAPGTKTNELVRAAFGEEVMSRVDGTVDRARLGAVVFADPAKRLVLNRLVWPAIRDLIVRDVAALSPGTLVVVEAAVLVEAQWTDLVDEVWVAVVDPAEAKRRLMQRNNLSAEQAQARIDAQMTNEERSRRAHVVVRTDTRAEDVDARADALLAALLKRHSPVRPERVLVVDPATNAVVDVRKRSVVRGFKLPHRATYCVITHAPSGSLYVQQRAFAKEYCPGMLDPAPGGVVSADDASYEDSARREMEEEMSMRGLDLAPVADFYFDDDRTRVWGRIFEATCAAPPDQLVLQAEEVHAVSLMSVDDVLRAADRVTADGMRALQVWLQHRPGRRTGASSSSSSASGGGGGGPRL